MKCPCGSDAELAACCGPYIEGDALPETAEALMRSRYSAYALEKVDYVVDTHDPATRGDLDEAEVREWATTSDWLGLDVVGTERGGPEDDEGVVEFVARYSDERDRVRVHRERSTFKRVDGRWYFHDGDVKAAEPVVREEPKIGRNDPCPCGSGKKYKKCHGRPGQENAEPSRA